MSRINTAALHNIIVERDMPKGYIWAKVVKCWTGDPRDARFFPPRSTDFGEELPAAYFTTVLHYDQESGWIERNIKFVESEAESAVLALKEDNQIACISCQGHLVTQSVPTPDGKTIARTIIMVKVGSTIIHDMEVQGLREGERTLEDAANEKMREIEPVAQSQLQSENMQVTEGFADESVWPSVPEPANLDDAPF